MSISISNYSQLGLGSRTGRYEVEVLLNYFGKNLLEPPLNMHRMPSTLQIIYKLLLNILAFHSIHFFPLPLNPHLCVLLHTILVAVVGYLLTKIVFRHDVIVSSIDYAFQHLWPAPHQFE